MPEEVEIKINDIDNFGNGVSKIDNFVVFIKGVNKDDIVKAKLQKLDKHFAIYEAQDIVNKMCPYYYKCGGCNYLHVSSFEELEMKNNYLHELFKGIKVNDIVSDNDFNYRNKVSLHVVNGKVGYFKDCTNDLVEIDKCVLLSENINKLIGDIKKLNLKNVTKILIREALYTKQLMVVFYGDIKTLEIDSLDCDSVYLNDKLVKGNPYLVEEINGLKYTIFPNSFFQVNTTMMIKLYDKIKEYAGSGEKLLDLYCGTGTIGMYLKDNFTDILGIEIVKDAIKNANINKKLNNISNINFKCGDASIVKNKSFSCVIVDPPRSGLSKIVLNNLISMDTKKIVYVSCNPKTLKRDLEVLSSNYKVVEITPFNMFYKTKEVECCCLLERIDE